ncbi:hypothetical protein ACS0TY_002887 [Phlomoides rotata]
MSDSLVSAHVEQLSKTKQEKSEVDKLAQELHAKSEEICEIRQLYEELQSSLHRKDLFLQQISSASEKRQSEYNDKILKLEGENRDLVLSLDEALVRIKDLEKKACASSEEIAGLKRLLMIRQEKNSEVQKSTSNDLKERYECIFKLEEEIRDKEDQLKWKNEQFSHLEEAHEKLRGQFQASKLEWQNEKSSLVDEISSLQATLDAQIRVSESLETQLRMCNQALAHEESRRKVLEIEVSEYNSKLENAFFECEETKSEIVQLTMRRDEEIAELRMLLRKKEMFANELEYKIQQLEQDNSDLLVSLKNIQEDQLRNNAAPSSLKILKNKLKALGQLHSKCATDLKEKEAEWNSQIERLTGDMNHCLSEMAVKNKSIRQLHKDLEDCKCLLEVKSEEIFALVLVLKSAFYDAYSKLYDAKEKLDSDIMQLEEKNMFLDQQLQLKNTELHNVHAELKQRCDGVAVSMEKAESLESSKVKDNIEEELKRLKAMLDESNECRSHLEQQLQELENTNRENIKDALEMVNSELANKTSELAVYELELQKAKSEIEIVKSNLKENEQAHKHEITNLLVTLNDKDVRIVMLEEQIDVLESGILAKSEAAEMFNQEKDKYIRLAEERNCSIKSLQNEIAQLKNDLAEKESANSALLIAQNTLEQVQERHASSVKEKDHKIKELQEELESLNQEFKGAMKSLAEKDVMLDEALKTAEHQKIIEVEETNMVIANLESEVNSLREKVEAQEKSMLESKQVALQVEEMKDSEMLALRSQLEQEKRCFEELESHKRALLEDRRKESIYRDNLLEQLDDMCGKTGVLSAEDVKLMGMLEKLLHLSEEGSEPDCDGFNCTAFSPSSKSIQVSFDERTPLTELNL